MCFFANAVGQYVSVTDTVLSDGDALVPVADYSCFPFVLEPAEFETNPLADIETIEIGISDLRRDPDSVVELKDSHRVRCLIDKLAGRNSNYSVREDRSLLGKANAFEFPAAAVSTNESRREIGLPAPRALAGLEPVSLRDLSPVSR
jgi:hypothetical protein